MKQIALKVTTLSPLSIRSDQSPTGANVAPYIPGSTLMGCLASVHRMLRSNQDKEFSAFFLSDKVQYPNLYPATFKNDRMQNAFTPLYCVPRTAQTCKRFKGFLSLPEDEPDDDEAHGVRDSLFDWALFALLNKSTQITTDEERGQIIAALEEEQCKSCAHEGCGEPLDNYDGFYRRGRNDARAIAKPKTRLITRTGINRKYGVVEETILYNREVYEEGICFFGVIQAEDDVATALQNFIGERGTEENNSLFLDDFARLGTARTRGFGRVAFEMEQMDEDEASNRFVSFKERLQLFDEALHNRTQISMLQPFYIALTLQAPVILSDELLRYTGTITGERFASLTGLSVGTFELLYHSASMRRIMGWQDLWGLPRTHAYALDVGAVFLFAVTQPLDDTLAHALFALEERGIGQRRAEGFGRICISDPFHRERDLR